MKFIRERKENYTVVSNAYLQDKSLGLAERGMLTTLLSLSDNWDFSTNGLASIFPCGRDAVTACLQRLELAGYLKRERVRNEKGQVVGKTVFRITDDKSVFDFSKPQQNKGVCPDTEKPYTGNPHTDNPIQVNTNISKEEFKVNNKENTNDISSNDIDEIYKAYPTKCFSRNVSTGKCSKNKRQIKILLKSKEYDKEKLITIIETYSKECKDNKVWVKNFGTFLNNVPDYSEIDSNENKENERQTPQFKYE